MTTYPTYDGIEITDYPVTCVLMVTNPRIQRTWTQSSIAGLPRGRVGEQWLAMQRKALELVWEALS
jgi:hypothetical protein